MVDTQEFCVKKDLGRKVARVLSRHNSYVRSSQDKSVTKTDCYCVSHLSHAVVKLSTIFSFLTMIFYTNNNNDNKQGSHNKKQNKKFTM